MRTAVLAGLALAFCFVAGCSRNRESLLRLENEILFLKDEIASLKIRDQDLERQAKTMQEDVERVASAVGSMDARLREVAVGGTGGGMSGSPYGSREGRSTPRPPRGDPLPPAVPGPYHLRVVSLPATELGRREAEGIADYLKRQGLPDVVARLSVGRTRHWVVDVGSVAATRSRAALGLKQKTRTMQYRGRRFHDAYWVKY